VLLASMIFVRGYVAENYPDNIWLRAVAGARDVSVDADQTSGRLDLAKMTLEKSASTIIGEGIQEVGASGISGSASAPLFWLLLTGIPGLVLLLARETVLVFYGCI